MRLCIPVSQNEGLESAIEPYLHQANAFLFFDTETRQHEHVPLQTDKNEPDERIRMDAVLCGAISRVTLRMLMTQGVTVYGTDAQVVSQAISDFEKGELIAAELDEEPAEEHGQGGCCGGKGHGEGHGHGGCGGHGHGKEHGGGCGGHGHGDGHGGGGCCGGKGH